MADLETWLCLASPKLAEGLSAPGVSSAPLPPILAVGTADYAALLTARPRTPRRPIHRPKPGCSTPAGTTGRPKGAVLTHRNLLFACHCYYADIDQIGPEDTILHAAPLTHGSGLYALAHIARGSHNVILSGSFDPERVLDAIASHANVAMFAAPTMVSRLINHAKAGATDHAAPQDHHLRWRADVSCADLKRALALFGPSALPALRPGREPR